MELVEAGVPEGRPVIGRTIRLGAPLGGRSEWLVVAAAAGGAMATISGREPREGEVGVRWPGYEWVRLAPA